jgi:hypothetical protein
MEDRHCERSEAILADTAPAYKPLSIVAEKGSLAGTILPIPIQGDPGRV